MAADSFINQHNHKTISTIYAAAIFNVHVEDGIGRTSKFHISVDKLSSRDLLQIRLCDVTDQTHMLISTIDNQLFEQIKCEQSLNVTFEGFVEHFTKILDACKRSELHLRLVRDTQPAQQLQFYEKRSFRNLVHLCVPIEEPPVKFVLYYINMALSTVQHQANMAGQQVHKLQKDIEYRDAQIGELRNEVKALTGRISDHENMAFNRNSEQVNRLQQDMKHLTESKDVEVRKLNHTVKTLQDTVDYLTKENYAKTDKCSQDTKKLDVLREEMRQMMANTKSIRDENEKLRKETTAHKSQERKSEHLLSELRKQLANQQDQLLLHEKQKNELEAELEAEKQITRTKRCALELATEEINKANSIIVRQAREMTALKQKVDWRTEVALQQERRVKELEENNSRLKQQLEVADEGSKENQDVGKHLQDLRNATDYIQRKYSRKIQDLKNQLHQVSAETKLNSSTNRYLQISNRSDKKI